MYEYKAIVRRVIDGDTIEVDIDLGFKTILQKEKLRLLGIDTPELRAKDPKEKELAKKAKEYVKELLPEGSEIIVVTRKDEKGKYGRYLAHVYFILNEKKENLSLLLNEKGFAKE